MSDNGSTERLRVLWEGHANRALKKAGRPERIDRRTLRAQGRSGPATIHEGPKSRAMARGGRRPQSQMREVRNAPGARRPTRRVDYPALDRGRSRAMFNADLKAQREREGWEAVDADNRRREMDELRSIHHPPEAQNMNNPPKGASPLHAGTNPEVPKKVPARRPETVAAAPRPQAKAPKLPTVPGAPPPLKVAKPDLGLAARKAGAPDKVQKPSLAVGPRTPTALRRGKGQEPDLER